MILVFIFLGIIIIIFFLLFILLLSSIVIQINNLELESKNRYQHPIKDYELIISIKAFNKINIFSKHFNNKKLRKIYSSKKLQKIDIKEIKKNVSLKNINLNIFKFIKIINVEKFILNIEIGTEDAIITSYLNVILASIIGIMLAAVTKGKYINKCKYLITPMYRSKNEYYIKLDSIISIKIVHIIYIIYIFIKKGRENNDRTSYRRTYDYSYERY